MPTTINNRSYSIDTLEERVYSVLGPISQRILIETRRQQGLVESFQKEYEKTKAKEFLGGAATSKSTLKLIEMQFNHLERISKIVDESKNATPDKLSSLSQESNSIMSQLSVNNGQYNMKWKLSELELKNLKIAVSGVLSERMRRAKMQTTGNTTTAKTNFENKKTSFDKKNPIKQFFANFAKKQTQIPVAEQEEIQKGRTK